MAGTLDFYGFWLIGACAIWRFGALPQTPQEGRVPPDLPPCWACLKAGSTHAILKDKSYNLSEFCYIPTRQCPRHGGCAVGFVG
jgi:hypothetical protein